MKKVIIFGVTDLAEIIFNYLKTQNDIEICAFTVDKDYLPINNSFLGLNVVPFEEIEHYFSKDEYSILICVGYNNMNESRKKVFDAVQKKEYKIESYIHPDSKFYSKNIGIGNIIFPGVIIDVLTKIGDGNIFYTDALLSHHSKVGNFNFFAVKSCITGHVNIDNNCFFGAHSTIKNGINISSYSLIGANAYVSNNTDKRDVVVPERSLTLKSKKSTDIIIK